MCNDHIAQLVDLYVVQCVRNQVPSRLRGCTDFLRAVASHGQGIPMASVGCVSEALHFGWFFFSGQAACLGQSCDHSAQP